jgi:hypothetical protein
LTGEFWSELLLRADEVLAIWPALGSSSPTFSHEQQRQRKLRQASAAIIDKYITAVYDAQNDAQKPPNVKELIPLVQERLLDAGFEASGNRIQGVAGEPKHQQRRRKLGKTVASERRRQPA